MPSPPAASGNRLETITSCLSLTAASLEILAGALKEPYLVAIFHTTQYLLKNIESLKQNPGECLNLLEQTYKLLNAILIAHIKSETGGELPPSVLNHIWQFTETIHKVQTFIEAQQKGSKLKRLFRQGELSRLLKNCKDGLQQGLDFFQINTNHVMADIAEMQQEMQNRHQEVLDLIETLSDTNSDRASTTSRVYSGSLNSSTSISMLPSQPKIFHGRDSEIAKILELFSSGTPRVAILGPGGIGKTSLARAVLHHTEITTRYRQHRHFVACDSATTTVEMAALIGAHVGLTPGKDLAQMVVQHFSSSPPTLLILDNLDTAWDPMELRNGVEELLSLLTDVGHLALMVTLRGAEHPSKVSWTHPFLPPLSPLEQDAARQTFLDITDDIHNPEEVDKVLALTDNMPLAITLLAHLVDSESCSKVLSRWEEEKTSVISDGLDRRSNLELSISLSLSSPRLDPFPQSLDVLSLLSMLPDGLSDAELAQSKLPIHNILGCKTTLIGTGLAYLDSHKRLRTLVLIREYMQKIYPPNNTLIRPLRTYFQALLELDKEYYGTSTGSSTGARISSNLANIHNILQDGLQQDHPDLVDCIYCTCYLNQFSLLAGQGGISLMNQIPKLFPLPCDHRLEAYFILELLESWLFHPVGDLDTLVSQGSTHLEKCEDTDLTCRFYVTLGTIQQQIKHDLTAALNSFETAISLATSAGNIKRHSQVLFKMAWNKWYLGNYHAAQVYANESQRLARISAHVLTEAQGLRVEAVCWHSLGHYSQSLLLCHRARDLVVSCGMTRSNLNHSIMNIQAEVHRSKSEYVEALNIHHQIIPEAPVTHYVWNHGFAFLNIAEIDVCIDVLKDDVQRNIDVARKIFSGTKQMRGLVGCDIVMSDLMLREGDVPAAKALILECLKLSIGTDIEHVSYCLEHLGNPCRWQFSAGTSTWTTVFLVHSLKFKAKSNIYKALQFLGEIFHVQADEETATNLLNVALDGFTHMDVHCSRAECMLYLGDISKQRGDVQKAVELWDTARPLFERSSQGKQVKKIDRRLAFVGEDVLEQQTDSSRTTEEVADSVDEREGDLVVD
ncbi:hypothetical protein DFH06DRAFT_1290675 [Mycena polygramma]|nr:hypothetical protein DFH06DRAFT_1290675 [Mycena polygramma]